MILTSLGIAVRALLGARLRSLLTALGILIGTAAVVVVVALGTGARERISNEISNIGNNLLFIFSQSSARSGARVTRMNLTQGDARALASEAPAVAAVTVWSTTNIRVHSEFDSHRTGVMGIDDKYFEVRGYSLARGRDFSESEVRSKAKVVIIGKTAQKELFGAEPGLGHYIRIGRHAYRIVGELAEKGRSSFEDQDDRVLMPIGSWRARIVPSRNDRVQLIMASARSSSHTEQAIAQIESILRQRHNIRENEPDDFMVRSQEGFRKAQDAILDMVTSLLMSVAAIALFVGGIGVMNIMLVSVAERTREIGVRMAIGAKPGDILLQFLCEAALLAIFGGVLGITTAAGVAAVLTATLGWSMKLDSLSILIALGTSLSVGLVFGILPARRAAQLDPIEALRHE
jgi:putative ABC transport system permease protein